MPKTDTAPAPKTQKPKAKSTDVAVLNKKDMVTTIVDMAKVSPKDAKAVVDAMLVVMGQALIEGKALALPPLGRLRVQKSKIKKVPSFLCCVCAGQQRQRLLHSRILKVMTPATG